MKIAAFSGGKDSTAMVLRLHELGEEFSCLFTPTGNELPELSAHMDSVMNTINKAPILPENKSLEFWIEHFKALPSNRMRWCTRLIKIQPCIEFLKKNPGSTLLVALRADEEERGGMYGEQCEYRYPLREWGWGIKEVVDYCRSKGVNIPKRTDCAWCYDQRLSEWLNLWREHPDKYAEAEALEDKYNHSFRNPMRDNWPARLSELRAKFEAGFLPKGARMQMELQDEEEYERCRVCRI